MSVAAIRPTGLYHIRPGFILAGLFFFLLQAPFNSPQGLIFQRVSPETDTKNGH